MPQLAELAGHGFDVACLRAVPPLGFIALILSSALVTIDGTAVTVALPAIGRDFSARFSVLQWTSNASLLALAALVLPAGALGDRYGRRRTMRAGLLLFATASIACATAPGTGWLIVARLVQGAGAALVVPGAIAILRATYTDETERTRRFGLWAGWSGLATAAGPLAGGLIVDLISWRAVFLLSAALAVATALLLGSAPESRAERASHSIRPTPALLIVALLAGVSILLINGGGSGRWSSPSSLIAATAIALSAFALWRSHQLTPVLPRELLCSANCINANAATFVLYFGVFGISFLLVIYTQAVLGYSATWSAITVLPTALAILVLAEPFGRAGAWIGPRALIMGAPLAAAAGVLWISMGPHPLPFWTHIVTGSTLFGLGVAMAVSPLTHAAISSVPEESAGTASGVHHATVRASGLAAIALLGSLAAAGDAAGALTVDGFRRALLVCAAVIAVAGVLAGSRIIDEAPGGLPGSATDASGKSG